MKDRIRNDAPENVLYPILALPCDCPLGGRLLDETVVVQRDQNTGQSSERIKEFAVLRSERADSVFQPTPKYTRRA